MGLCRSFTYVFAKPILTPSLSKTRKNSILA
jgi:hypothetical protein